MAIADYGLRENDGDVISRFFLLWSISTDFIYVLSYNYHNAISNSVPSLPLSLSLQTNQRPVSLQGTLIDQMGGSSYKKEHPHIHIHISCDLLTD